MGTIGPIVWYSFLPHQSPPVLIATLCAKHCACLDCGSKALLPLVCGEHSFAASFGLWWARFCCQSGLWSGIWFVVNKVLLPLTSWTCNGLSFNLFSKYFFFSSFYLWNLCSDFPVEIIPVILVLLWNLNLLLRLYFLSIVVFTTRRSLTLILKLV